MKYFIPAVLTFLISVALWAIKRERKRLEYEVFAWEASQHGAGTGRYYMIRLRNSGNVAVQDTRFSVSFEQGIIESSRWSDPSLVADISTSESKLQCLAPLLNPRECIVLTITTIGGHVIDYPKVEARAVGVTATAKSEDTTTLIFGVSLTEMVGPLVMLLIMVLASWYYVIEPSGRQSVEKILDASGIKTRMDDLEQSLKEESQGKPHSAHIMFTILNRAGVGHLFIQLAATSQDVSYWGTGLLLVNSFLLDQANSQKYVTALEELGKTPMMPASLGFNLYLLSKVERFRGNTARADDYLDRCKQETPLIYQHLMQQDQYFDLRLLQKQLRMVQR